MEEIVFTSSAVLDLLSQIDELSEFDIDISESNNNIQFIIGSSKYNISTDKVSDVLVDKAIIHDVEAVNTDTYENMLNSSEFELHDVESSVIKQVVKTLLVGGLVRLTNKILN